MNVQEFIWCEDKIDKKVKSLRNMIIYKCPEKIFTEKNKDVLNKIINYRNKCQHFEFIISDLFKNKKDSNNWKEFIDIFNFNHRHTLSLNILSAALLSFTTINNEFLHSLLESNDWLFKYSDIKEIMRKQKERTQDKNVLTTKDTIKVGELNYIFLNTDCTKYKFSNFYILSLELLCIKEKGQNLYLLRKRLAEIIKDYIKNFISITTINKQKCRKEIGESYLENPGLTKCDRERIIKCILSEINLKGKAKE